MLLLILRIISKGDYFSWLEFYFKILNCSMQVLDFWGVLLVFGGFLLVMYSKLSAWEGNTVFL